MSERNTFYITLWWTFIFTSNAGQRLSGDELDKFLTRMDNRIRPNVDGEAVEVKCNVYVVSFGSINERDMDYTINIYLRQRWSDQRFQFNDTGEDRPLVLDANTMKRVWMPDIFFPNEKRASFHDMTVPNRMMRVFPNGTIVYSLRLTMTVACSMNLHKFPMDDQKCSFKMESYSYDISELTLKWFGTDAVEVDSEDLELPQFDLVSVETSGCIRTYKTGHFPCLKATFYLHRQFGFYLLQTYIPTILIVILSWVSFWLHVDAVPARISLGVTTVLTMATQLSGSRESAPKVSYPKALDVWMAACMLFVFSALLEYAFVNVLAREKKQKNFYNVSGKGSGEERNHQSPTGIHMNDVSTVTLNNHSDHVVVGGKNDDVIKNVSVRLRKPNDQDSSTEVVLDDPTLIDAQTPEGDKPRAVLLDNTSKIVFPLSFLIFNAFYWPVYLYF